MIPYDRDGASRPSEAPSDDAYMITPIDGLNLPTQVRALRVATAGDLRVINRQGIERVVTLLASETFSCGVVKVFATGTTVTGILGYV